MAHSESSRGNNEAGDGRELVSRLRRSMVAEDEDDREDDGTELLASRGSDMRKRPLWLPIE